MEKVDKKKNIWILVAQMVKKCSSGYGSFSTSVKSDAKLHHAKSKLIFNGYEESLFDELSALPTTSDRFVITIFG